MPSVIVACRCSGFGGLCGKLGDRCLESIRSKHPWTLS